MAKNEPPMAVRRLRACMVMKNIRPADVAEAAGVTRPCVTLVISGRENSARVMQVLNNMGVPKSLTDEVARC